MQNDEIGSEFWSVPTQNSENDLFPTTVSWHLSGRAALHAILKAIKKKRDLKKAALPSWCCDSMVMPFLAEQIEVEFYPVCAMEGGLQCDFSVAENCDVILTLDYFGFVRKRSLPSNVTVICDLTHSVFCPEERKADYFFGSLRKWAGFYTGGFAYSSSGELIETSFDPEENRFIELRKKAMVGKAEYVEAKHFSKDFLSVFSEAEEFLDFHLTGAAAERDVELAKRICVDEIRSRRRENASVLIDGLSEYSLFDRLLEKDVPLFVPIKVEGDKRNALKKHLIENQIYCPVHWPISNLHILDEKTRDIYEREISLVCDQRYTVSDMERIVAVVKTFL